MVTNNFCIAIVDFGPEGKPKVTWTFDIIDCPIIFKFFKEKGLPEKVFNDTVRIALATLEELRVVLCIETDLKNIIHQTLESEDGQDSGTQ